MSKRRRNRESKTLFARVYGQVVSSLTPEELAEHRAQMAALLDRLRAEWVAPKT